MVRLLAVTIACALLIASACTSGKSISPEPVHTASRSAPQDARTLLREATDVAQRHALQRDGAAWTAWCEELELTIPEGAPPRVAYPAINDLLRRYGDAHCRFVPPPEPTTPGATPSALAEPGAVPTHPPIPTLPEGRVLSLKDRRICYILLPGCPGETQESRVEYAVRLRGLLDHCIDDELDGIIIDLRLNGGGNVWPMLAGLRTLLGDGTLATSIGPAGIERSLGCSLQDAWLKQGDVTVNQLSLPDTAPARMLPSFPCAVLIGPWTMSSGELIASTLKGRAHTRLFGEPTAGLTTGTNSFALSDGSALVLSVDQMADRTGTSVGARIDPQQLVASKDWPSSEDAVTAAAADWLKPARPSSATRRE